MLWVPGETPLGFQPPLYDRLAAQGAVFAAPAGCPYPEVFVKEGAANEVGQYCQTPSRNRRFAAVFHEHQAVRTGVGIFDFTMLCKFDVTGSDALALVSWVSTNEVDVPVGKIVYTAWCNEDGLFLADGTIARLGRDNFRLVGTDIAIDSIRDLLTMGVEHLHTLSGQAPRVLIVDRSQDLAIINVQGRNLSRILRPVGGFNYV